MTTQAPHQPRPVAAGFTIDEQATAALTSPDETTLNALSLLDHRIRARAVPPGVASPGHYLLLADGDQQLLVPLDDKVTHLGRGIGSDLRFDQHHVSRNHAIVVLHGRYARVLDNRSANGTFVNGRQIIATNLSDGDVIRLGPVAMQYVVVR